jgi:hypothetical protein
LAIIRQDTGRNSVARALYSRRVAGAGLVGGLAHHPRGRLISVTEEDSSSVAVATDRTPNVNPRER